MIRKAQDTDIPIIVEMVGHFIQARYSDILTFKPKRVAELCRTVQRVGCILVAERDGKVIGFVAGCALEDSVSGIPMLDEMAWWVEPAYRNGSTGPKLLGSFEKWARQKGLSMVKMVAPAGSGVGKYLKRLGYIEIETSFLKRLR